MAAPEQERLAAAYRRFADEEARGKSPLDRARPLRRALAGAGDAATASGADRGRRVGRALSAARPYGYDYGGHRLRSPDEAAPVPVMRFLDLERGAARLSRHSSAARRTRSRPGCAVCRRRRRPFPHGGERPAGGMDRSARRVAVADMDPQSTSGRFHLIRTKQFTDIAALPFCNRVLIKGISSINQF